MFGFKHNYLRPVSREDITKLEYTRESFEYDSDGARKNIALQINTRAETSEYPLGDKLASAELDWLTKELSSWLEISIDYK